MRRRFRQLVIGVRQPCRRGRVAARVPLVPAHSHRTGIAGDQVGHRRRRPLISAVVGQGGI